MGSALAGSNRLNSSFHTNRGLSGYLDIVGISVDVPDITKPLPFTTAYCRSSRRDHKNKAY